MKKLKLLNFFRVVFLLLMFSAFSSSAWAGAGVFAWNFYYYDGTSDKWYNNDENHQILGDVELDVKNNVYIKKIKVYFWKDGSGNICGEDAKAVLSTNYDAWFQNNTYTHISGNNYSMVTNDMNYELKSGQTIDIDFILKGNDSSNSGCGTTFDSFKDKKITIKTSYALKHPWDGGDWQWKELDANNELIAKYGGACVNINYNDNDCKEPILACSVIPVGEECVFKYNPTDNSVTITPVGNCPLLLNADKVGPYSIDEEVIFTADGGTGTYSWSIQNLGESTWNSLTPATTTTCKLKIKGYSWLKVTSGSQEKTFFINVEQPNEKVLFVDSFGEFNPNKLTGRAELDANVTTSYSYVGGADECNNNFINTAGEYAIVATPRYSGCAKDLGENSSDIDNRCNCDPTSHRLWYRNIFDRTHDRDNSKYGGMLQFDCNDGSETDILYSREVEVCSDVYVKFSAWVQSASQSNSNPIKSKFVLYKGTGPSKTKIDDYMIENLDVSKGWTNISTLFFIDDDEVNKVTIELVNLAPYGNKGNDLLVDDIEFSVCTPTCQLKATYDEVTSTTTIDDVPYGGSLSLSSELLNGSYPSKYYKWQYSVDGTNWMDISSASTSSSTCTIKTPLSEEAKNGKVYYRVILAVSEEEAIAGAAGGISGCGSYSVSNTIEVNLIEVFAFSENPKLDTVCAGKSGELSATTNRNATFTWQKKTGNTWSNITENITSTSNSSKLNLNTNSTDGESNTEYRVIATENGTSNQITSDPVIFKVNALPTVTISGTERDCPSSDVELTATVTGGKSPYSYAWTGAEGTTHKASAIFPATCTTKNVSVKVTDNNNCVGSGNYTLEAVAEKPTIETELKDKDFGCSALVEPELSDFIVTDKCAPATSTPQVTLTSSEVSTTNCKKSQTWTATYTGSCDKAVPISITYTWTDDSEKPTIGTIETTINLESKNCVFTVPDLEDKVLAVTTDNCTANSDLVYSQDLTVGEEITEDKILNVTVTDACGNETTKEFTLNVPDYPSLSYKLEDVKCSDDKNYYTAEISANTGTLTVTSGDASVSKNTDGTWTLKSTDKSDSSVKLTTEFGCTTTLDIIAPDCSCPTIDAPKVSNNSYCKGATTLPALEADATLGTNEQIEWYDAYTDGNLLVTGTSYTPTSAGTYYVQVRNIVDGCKSIRVPVTLTENALPTVTISGTASDCPSSDVELTATVTGGTSPYTYAWTEAEGTAHKASAKFPTTCTTKNVSVKVTDNNNCVGSGNYTLKAVAEKPTIETELKDKDFGCSALVEPELSDFIVTDKCAPATSTPQVTLTSSEVSTTNCVKSQTWTATYTGSCGEVAEPISITYTWTVAEKPTIETELKDKDFGCSALVEPELSDFIVTDKCAPATSTPQVTLTSSEVSTTNCVKSQTWTATYDGVCESAEEVKITYTWTEDSEKPTIGTIETTINLESTNCLFTVPDLKDKVLAVTTDNCTANSDLVYNQDLTVGEEITTDKILNVTVTDACGNKTTIEFTLKIPAYPSLSYEPEDVACSDDKTYYTAIISANIGTLTVTSGNASVSENTDGTWTLTSTNKSNSNVKLTTVYGCTTTLDIIAPDCSCPNIDAPEVSSNSYCLGATTLPALEAEATLDTNEQIEWYDADTDGILLETGTSYTPTSAGTYYVQVRNIVDGCKSIRVPVTLTENALPVLDIQSVYELCPSDTLTTLTLSSFLPKTEGVTYKFYDESGEEIEDVYEVSSESPVTTYYVIGTAANGCQSEKTSFEVDFAKNVDFTLTTSQSSMMVGGNETIVEIVPDADSDDAATYVWTANDQELSVDGLQYVDNLYLDTNFKVTASNRCDSDTQEAFVEVLWPTAFTPHNGNGKNDTFAKGMHIIVFNRFYTKIFEGEDGWDGSINGTMNSSKQTAVPGVYFYSVQLPNGQVKKGTIEIVKVD